MSKEKSCKCCKQIWYTDMLDKKWRLCPNCYGYCKPLINDLKIKDKKIAKLQHKLEVAERTTKLACDELRNLNYKTFDNSDIDFEQQFKEQAEKELKEEKELKGEKDE